MRGARALAAALLVLGVAGAPAKAGPGAVGRPLVFEVPAGGPLEFRGAVAVSPPFDGFGGISGLAHLGSGAMLAVTDKGDWLRFALAREDGRLTGIADIVLSPILDGEGRPVGGDFADAEDIARDPATGRVWVSFESRDRVVGFPGPDAPGDETFAHPDWRGFGVNSGIEALARDDRGRLWAIREVSGRAGRPFRVYVREGGGWTFRSLPRPTGHAVTGAAFGPDGWLYLTERRFGMLSGFDIRLRRVRWEGAAESPAADELLAEFPPETGIDNIEAVALWREGGETLMLIASDDNFFPFQRNVFALFAVGG